MAIIRGRKNVLDLYSSAASRGWVIPTFCAENQTTIEAVLHACQQEAEEIGGRIPVTLAITGRYDHRPQSVWYSTSRDWRTGLDLFLDDVEVLARNDGPYALVDVTTHFDHGQPDIDREVLEGPLDRFSSVMFDASAFPWEENIERTRAFVDRCGDTVVVEGAADEIVDAGGGEEHTNITTPERAAEFIERTKADFVVANLGTEHRASASSLHYHSEAARAIAAKIGARLVLHGASSVPPEQLSTLLQDGICKVNIWTILERDSSNDLFCAMLADAPQIASSEVLEKLVAAGTLPPSIPTDRSPSLTRFTTAWRNEVTERAMFGIVKHYLDIFYGSAK